MILQKVQRSTTERRRRPEMLAHEARLPRPQPVVDPLVVREVETLCLQRPLEAPVNLGDEEELGVPPADMGDGLGPEGTIDGRCAVPGPPALAPGSRDALRLEQHRHVATDA